MRLVSVAAIVVVTAGLVGCSPPTPSSTPADAPVESVPPAPAPAPGPAITVGEPDAAGAINVVIDPAALEPTYYSFVETNPSDPYYHFHTDQTDLYLGVELYTQYAPGWSGQLGTFPVNCSTHGICVYLDVDGTGPMPVSGPATAGQISIAQLEGGYDLTLSGVTVGEYVLGDVQFVG